MNIFDDENFKVFERTLARIKKEYDTILPIFGGDIHAYVSHTATPYNISIHIQSVVAFVDANYIELSSQVKKIFNNTQQMNNAIDNFTKYYGLMSEALEKPEDDEENKTLKIALVLILISRNINNAVAKKIQVILKSMCIQPTIGTLVQVSSNVLSEV